MQRRSTAVTGCVRFPVADSAWKNAGEGGMVVKLVVCDNRDFDDQFGVCSGAQVFDLRLEPLVGDDRRPHPVPSPHFDTVEAVQAEQRTHEAWEAYHFPHTHDEALDDAERIRSREYLASVVLGSTGWSGRNAYLMPWVCHFEDLTEEGQALYRQFERLYPGCALHLLTFLDT